MISKTRMIKHRVNTIDELKSIQDLSLGCEIDVRSDINKNKALYLSHDPWVKGDDFLGWIKEFSEKKMTGPLVLNTKEDGLEEELIEQLDQHNIKNYFFLDTIIPTLVRLSLKEGLRHFGVRLSKYESLETILNFKGAVEWIWLDCFEAIPLGYIEDIREKMGAKLCLVSPELQGGKIDSIQGFYKWARGADAICTKHPEVWSHILLN